ncbi:hypothetical protein Taro_003987 [Colocasia esculenta]|uniref:Exocyst component Exo84 C-terminal domain-containing protein n=1 Tax=Colocasia esculenta TaxID=4460 RepID=A0A843TIV0_COLES|nr:hypothetical protein [Colocasia esculenta]
MCRVLKEVGDVESELLELKRHVSDQKRLVKDLTERFFNGTFSEDLLESKLESDLEVEDHLLISEPHIRCFSILEKLDVLYLDQQFEGALDILETEETILQKVDLQGDVISAENFASCRSALSEWRTRLADQLASMAGHPRVNAPELQKSLVLICRLGESSRANSLLIQFYHLRLVKRLRDLQQCSKSLLSQLYMVELVKTTFSVISQAARSFVMLSGETSAYSSEFILWATEEIKMFTHYFDAYIKSSYEKNTGLRLAVESMRCAFYHCSLLESERLVLHPYLIQSVRPCMEEAYHMHVDYLRSAIRVFTATDTWVLGKFIVPGITRDTASLAGDGGKLEYSLLTSSGRKFANLEDISPLCSLQMGNSILKGLADLFTEYIKILECAIPRCGSSVEEGSVRVNTAQKLSQQLSLLANAWTLVDYFFSVAKCISEDVKASSDEQIPDTYGAPRHEEPDKWNFSIQDAADHLGLFICQQLVDRYISAVSECRTSSESYSDILDLATSPESPMPSSEFQMLFQQLRQLEKNSKSVFGGADERVKKLLDGLVDSLVAATSHNNKLWRYNEHSSPTRKSIWFEQIVLDMHFLVEIARFGGHLSDRLMEATRSLMVNIQNTFLHASSDISAVPDVSWASRYAKSAIQKLVEQEATQLEWEKEHMNASEEEFVYQTAPASEEQDFTLREDFDAFEQSSHLDLRFVPQVELTMEELSESDGNKLSSTGLVIV